jgi:tetratricopeptide (TPR) repeat protein
MTTMPDPKARLDRLALEIDNLRAAIKWAISHGEADLAVRLCVSLPVLWFRTGTLEEGKVWLERVLAMGPALSDANRAQALNLLGRIRQIGGDNSPEVASAFEESLTIYRRLDDRKGIARALMNLGNLKRRVRELDAAEQMFREALDIYREIGEAFGHGGALLNLGDLYSARGNREQARAYFEEAREISRRGAARTTYAFSLQYLGTMAVVDGELDRAQELYEESRREFENLGARPGMAWSRYYLAIVARERGNWAQARELFSEALTAVNDLGHLPAAALALLGLAGVEAAEGHYRRAAVLLGAAREIHRRATLSTSPVEERSFEEVEEASRRALGDEEVCRALEEGRALSMAEAVRLALAPEVGVGG